MIRGSKTGLETRIRQQKASHLLDIDGDVCHHVHNAAKAFCKPFKYFIEQMYNDLFNDFKWSSDLREMLQEICEMCGVKYTMSQDTRLTGGFQFMMLPWIPLDVLIISPYFTFHI